MKNKTETPENYFNTKIELILPLLSEEEYLTLVRKMVIILYFDQYSDENIFLKIDNLFKEYEYITENKISVDEMKLFTINFLKENSKEFTNSQFNYLLKCVNKIHKKSKGDKIYYKKNIDILMNNYVKKHNNRSNLLKFLFLILMISISIFINK